MQKARLPKPAAWRPIMALMLREMAATYGRSPGGWLWAIAEPVAAIALLAAIFQMAFDAPPLGRSFILFYATGYLPFMLFTDVSMKVANALRFSRQLLAYPVVAPLDALLARLALNLATHLVVFGLVLAIIGAMTETGALYDPPKLLAALGLTALLAFGVGCLNCVLFHRVPLWERAWQIVTRPLFLISGVFFLVEDIPADYREVALWNPLLHLTSLSRDGTYLTYDAPDASAFYVAVTGLVCMGLGLMGLRLTGKDPAYA